MSSRSKKILQMALVQSESRIEPSKNTSAFESNNGEELQNVHADNHSYTVQDITSNELADRVDICNIPIIIIDGQGNSLQLPNNSTTEENGPQLEVFNTAVPEITEGGLQTMEVDNVKINIHKTNTDSWSATEQRMKREKGDAYLGRKKDAEGNCKYYDVKRNKRQMKVRCSCKLSRNNKGLMCSSINEDQRKQIFTEFWKMSWKEKRVCIQMLCDWKPTQRARDRKETEKSRRSISMEYYFKIGHNRVRVCKNMFLNTLCIGEWSVRNWLKNSKKSGENICEGSSRDENNTVPVSKRRHQKEIRSLEDFFHQIPKIESHYCRASSKKLYLEPLWKSKSDLYEFYKSDWGPKSDINYVSKTTFKQLFKKNNFSLFTPKKDACDICAGFKTKNIDEEIYNAHIEKKEEARNEKQKDKASSSRTLTMDLQGVLLAPKSNVSAMYYKTKLAVHNMTFFDLQSKDGTCFLWNEMEGKLTADEFSSIIICHLETVKNSLKDSEKNIIMFSDGCNYQNRNSMLANALLNFSVANNIVVIQKYLERGHTQMEVDAMHSTIERKLKGVNINVPADYIRICKSARRLPKPYEVFYHSHFFKNFSGLKFLTSIRPGKRIGDPTVTDLRALKYNPNGTVQYKLRFGEAWKDLPLRINKITAVPFAELPTLYKERLPVKNEKYNHLQILKSTLEKDYHTFYENIPHK